MTEKKTKTRRRKAQAPKVQLSEADQKHFEEHMKDADEETKTQWLKRRAAEDEAVQKNKKVVDVWYQKSGSKLVRKTRKASGGVITNYIGNYVNNPKILTEEIKEKLRG